MSATQTVQLIEKLTAEANISKNTAVELVEYIEKKQTDTVTKDYFAAEIKSGKDKIKGVEEKLRAEIKSVEEKLRAEIKGLRLFTGFNTVMLITIMAKLFLS